MVNPINNNYPTEYQPSSGKTVKVDNEGHFSLSSALNDETHTQSGVLYEPSQKKTTENPTGHTSSSSETGNNKRDSFESSLDKAIREREQTEKQTSAFRESLMALWENVRTFFSNLWHNIKKMFGNVWESKPLAEGMESMRRESPNKSAESLTAVDSSAPGSPTSPTLLSESGNNTPSNSIDALEAERDSKIRQALADGNRDEFRSLISDDGKKIPAHNTSMLTTYDSSGKLVNIDPSDENKILHGDRGTRKL